MRIITLPPPLHDTLDHLPTTSALIVLCGPIGAGKTTLCTQRWPEQRVTVEQHDGSWRHAYATIADRLDAGELVVFDSTAVTLAIRKSLRRIAGRSNVDAHLVVVDTDLAVAQTRNRSRAQPVDDQEVALNHEAYLVARWDVQVEAWHSVTMLRGH